MSERDLIERLRQELGGIETPMMNGDNLALTLCSHFDNPDQPTDDEHGWSEDALRGQDEVLDAVHAHYAATITRLSEALAEAEKKGAEEGVAKCLEHIAYVRANIRVTPKDRVRFSVSDLNFAFRSALDVLKERITGEDEGKWHEEDATPPPRDLSQGGQP